MGTSSKSVKSIGKFVSQVSGGKLGKCSPNDTFGFYSLLQLGPEILKGRLYVRQEKLMLLFLPVRGELIELPQLFIDLH